MQADEFWCRAFLAAMGGNYTPPGVIHDHEEAAAYCERAAAAALEVARRRGMVTGERTASAIDAAALRWLNALRENNVDASEAAERDLLRAAEALDRGRSVTPELQRLKFTAERDGDIWTIHSSGLTHGVQVRAGGERYPIGPIDVLCVKWTETMPPKPAEVWIERPAKEGA